MMRQAIVFCLLAGLIASETAAAATTVEVGDAVVVIADETGDPNTLEITYADGVVGVSDETATLEPGEGCTSADGAVRCEVEALQVIRALLGGGDDSAVVESPPPVEMHGGDGDDRLEGGVGRDSLIGGGGEDHLYGGGGDDELSDGDHAAGEIDSDTVIGGTGDDTINSYADRSRGVRLDLTERGGDGQRDENDDVVNVEIVYGGFGGDRLIGDGDANVFVPGGGRNRVVSGRGDDRLVLTFPDGRNVVNGGRGDDVIEAEAFEPGTLRCGQGRDLVTERLRRSGATRRADPERDFGPEITAGCEELVGGGWRIDPVPDEPLSGRLLHFDRLPGRLDPDFRLDLTTVGRPPFQHVASGDLMRDGVTLRFPVAVVRRTRRDGSYFRAKAMDTRVSELRLLWRFLHPRQG